MKEFKADNIVLSGTGVFIPDHCITNEELVNSYNQYVDFQNSKENIKSSKSESPDLESRSFEKETLKYSSSDFIVKAAGIEKRYVVEKSGILDIHSMRPKIPERPDEEPSLQCEMAVAAAKEAMRNASLTAKDIDAVIVACSNTQRAYPAIAIEVQNALGIEGFAFDVNVACSSATFAIQLATDAISRGSASTVLVVNPEIMSGHLNFRDRDCHFIFGDAATATIVQQADQCKAKTAFQILGTQLKTQFSNNIRNNFGFLYGTDPNKDIHNTKTAADRFKQQGRKVFKEVIPLVADLVLEHLHKLQITANNIKRLWLHQANANMNRIIATKILNREPEFLDAPTILQEYGNTSSPGAIIAFHQYHQDLQPGDIGILCAFGAGYSVGNIVLQRV